MFTGAAALARSRRRPAPPRPASINHGCFSLDGFKPDEVIEGARERRHQAARRRHRPGWPAASLRLDARMENRGGAPEGTPELYFTDPDGLLMQLQDTRYCGGSGVLGNTCK